MYIEIMFSLLVVFISVIGLIIYKRSCPEREVTQNLDMIISKLEHINQTHDFTGVAEDFKGMSRSYKDSDISCDSSILYLKRKDVHDQISRYLLETKSHIIAYQLRECLATIYVCMLISNTTEKYILNFWPCSECACVAFEKVPQTN